LKIGRLTGTAIFLLCFCCFVAGIYGSGKVVIQCLHEKISAFQGEKVIPDLKVSNGLSESIRPENHYYFSYHIYDTRKKLVK
jgi:hypothetical protein